MSKPIIDIMNQKFILELNAALAMENAGIERLQTRIEEVSLSEARQQLEHHLLQKVLFIKFLSLKSLLKIFLSTVKTITYSKFQRN